MMPDASDWEAKIADAEERAAIIEFDGKASRRDAETMAERQCGLLPGALKRNQKCHPVLGILP